MVTTVWIRAVLDHPIFTASIASIRRELAERAAADALLAGRLQAMSPLQRDVLERCIHSSGDLTITADLVVEPAEDGATAAEACRQGLEALQAGAPILCDTAMATAAVAPMARRTLGNPVHCLLDWAPLVAPPGSTRSAAAIDGAWAALAGVGPRGQGPGPIVLIGSAPTALERLLDLVAAGAPPPALVIGMPVGFIGVAESKRRLAASALCQIRLDGPRGGAGLAGAACNALLRAAALQAAMGARSPS